MPLDIALGAARACKNPEAADRIIELRKSLQLAKESIRKAQHRQGHYVDQHRRDIVFKVGDRVLLSTEHLKLIGENRSIKFANRHIGPFKIIRVVGSNAYELELPPQMQIHPVLNVSRLLPYRDGLVSHPHRAQVHDRPPPKCGEDGAEVYEIERILARRGARGPRTEYLVEWKGYPLWESSWVKKTELGDAREAIAEYESSL